MFLHSLIKPCVTAFMLATYGAMNGFVNALVETETLSVRTVADGGFGCKRNLYSWTMESFKGDLYVGTLNIIGGSLGMNLFLTANPVLTHGGEIHRGTRSDDGDWTWTKVVDGGLTAKENFGFRKLIAVEDYLYGVSANHESGFIVARTSDGENWEVVNEPGMGKNNNISGRGMVVFRGYLYVGTENRKDGSEIWRRSVEEDGDFTEDSEWESVIDGGAGNYKTRWFSDFVEYKDHLYVGTLNTYDGNSDGAEMYRSADGVTWELIFDEGLDVRTDRGVMKMVEFDGRLYAGTMNLDEGASLLVSNNDSNDTVVEDFDYLWKGGKGNPDNIYTWYMIEFEGRLYVGTFHSFGQQEFDLYSSADPINDDFVTETTDAFGNNNIYGIRCMTIHDGRLMIGGASNNKPTMVFEATLKSNEGHNLFDHYNL